MAPRSQPVARAEQLRAERVSPLASRKYSRGSAAFDHPNAHRFDMEPSFRVERELFRKRALRGTVLRLPISLASKVHLVRPPVVSVSRLRFVGVASR